jgi:hypothetical protein
MALTDLHRGLLQAFMSHRVLPQHDALEILSKLLKISTPEDGLHTRAPLSFAALTSFQKKPRNQHPPS